ncbi:MAG: GtrA family protein [Bifidobacteriaceae bacterium]|jgi:putative flippase GtrA|nr:GtrA family protein [Bifidobacteriaceae bacterium]
MQNKVAKKENWFYHLLQFMKFGTVGAICYFVDVGISNLLVYVNGVNFLSGSPLTAKVVSMTISTLLSWILNRNWAFKKHKTNSKRKELFWYIVLTLIGMGIALVCVGFTVYIMHLTDAVSYNISANIIGTGLGTVWRFLAYKFILYRKK